MPERIRITLPPIRPRNPLVPLVKTRRGGAHGKSGKARRQADRVALQRRLREGDDT